MFWDLWLFLRHVLLFQVVLFLSQLLVLVQPQVIRVQSSKVSNIFLNGHVFNVETIQGYEWVDLPVSRWLDKVCSIYILDEPSCLLILALDPGSVKYDPLLSQHRNRLLYLTMLLQRGSELLIMRGKSPQEAREILISCDPFQEEVARVKKAFEIDQHAVWSLRNQTALTNEEAVERSTRMKTVAKDAHERHGKAIGQPWSEVNTTHQGGIRINMNTILTGWTVKQFVKEDFSKPVRFTCCKACGLSLFSGDNTSHRCTEETDLVPVQRPQFDRSIMLGTSDAVTAFGEPEGGLPDEVSTVAVLDVLRLSELWDIFAQYVQDRYPAALAELEATMNTDPRPNIILAAGTFIDEGEYDALVWAITALWLLMRGNPASEHRPTSRMPHKLRSNLVKSLQRDSAEAAIRIVCDVKPPCDHDEIASAINDKGERRRLQHPHPV
ncbi:unnamed protein product [Tilletia caries]|nr:unnamed protein product [Tilletia caries]CAD6916279.1 unnamed protein product [Tilletia caries]CAD6973819.1 unnamed protein product [Tilletia controversa]